MGAGASWTLRDHAGVLLADLAVTDGDFPWLYATVRPTGAFAPLRPIFDAELRALRVVEDGPDDGAWDRAYQQVRAAVVLIDPDGVAVPEFLLHIDGDQAWWRWIDEPFDDDEDDDGHGEDDDGDSGAAGPDAAGDR
ncbi:MULTISPECIES: hypothetical protein [unclassified Solwaraspora]|uniref:hypothetical protein n=1 Tax=unclassified Solwaraspora TaxID=2627926 RepID=UPI00259B1DB5|nr:hypothetical protein [Solwaraspora sp. WMMA2056]WJK40692.1 hypothetical protein O7608_30650 [Solwaraspora sp. WMMA2056]